MATIISLLDRSRPVLERSAQEARREPTQGEEGPPGREESNIAAEVARGITTGLGGLVMKSISWAVVSAIVAVGGMLIAIVWGAWNFDERFAEKVEKEIEELKEDTLAPISAQMKTVQTLQQESASRIVLLGTLHEIYWAGSLLEDTFNYAYVPPGGMPQYIVESLAQQTYDTESIRIVFYENRPMEFASSDNDYLMKIAGIEDFWFVSGSVQISSPYDPESLEYDIKRHIDLLWNPEDKILIASSETTDDTNFALAIPVETIENSADVGAEAYERLSRAREETQNILRHVARAAQ